MHRLLFSITLASVATLGLASAQGPAPESADVVVVRAPTRETIRNFIDEIATSGRGVDQLSRWNFRVCPGVVGLRPNQAQFLIDRVAQRALEVGLSVGEPGCRANALVLLSTDPDAIAEQIFEGHRRALGFYSERGRITRGRSELQEFVASDAPVRWWHVSYAYDQNGQPITEAAIPDPIFGDAQVTMRHGGPSRLRRGAHYDFSGVVIIVDGRQIGEGGLDLGALGDYVAMVTLAEIDPAAETEGLSTILNLFSQPDGPHALTEWDLGYLRGLYATSIDDNGQRQRAVIADTMEENVQQH